LGWFTVPLNVLACLAFALISEAGRVLEDPFTLLYNGLPLSALSRTIEVNLREQLGDPDLPPLLKPDAEGILL
jgi:putative membrane protein